MLDMLMGYVSASPESERCMIQLMETMVKEVTLTQLPMRLHILSLLRSLINMSGISRQRETNIEAIFESQRKPSVI